MAVNYSPDDAKVGTSFTLELDTAFAGLSGLTNHRIYFRKPRQVAAYKSAEVFSSTWLRANFDPTDTDRKMNLRTWTYAQGTGTIIFKGKTFVVPVINEDE